MGNPLIFVTGATGLAGFAVLTLTLKTGYAARVSVRKESQIPALRDNHLVAPYVARGLVDFVVAPDMSLPGVFDDVLKDVTGVIHVASPLPFKTDNPERDIVNPAVAVTTRILESALLHPSIRRVVITSSIVAIADGPSVIGQHPDRVHTAKSRVSPLPGPPFASDLTPEIAYRHSKVLALAAIENFIAEKKPAYSIVTVHPGYIIGRHELATRPEDLLIGSNGVPLSVVLGVVSSAGPRPNISSHLDDVARFHVESLDEVKVPGKFENFLVEGGKQGEWVVLQDVVELSKKEFPEAWEKGWFKDGGTVESGKLRLDSTIERKIFGESKDYAQAVRDVLGQYVELKQKEKASTL